MAKRKYFKDLIHEFIELFFLLKKLMLIPKINATLNIQLYRWQINFIFFDKAIPAEILNSRVTGKTTARVLKVLLSEGNPLYFPSVGKMAFITQEYFIRPQSSIYRSYFDLYKYLGEELMNYRSFRYELEKTMKLLNSEGIKTRKLFFER